MTDTKAEKPPSAPQGKDDSISSILREANEIINEFEGKPKEPQLKLSDGSEINDAAKRAKLMMANAQQQLQARQQKMNTSPVKRKTPVTSGVTPQQIQRPPVQPPRQHNVLGDSGVNSNTMAQMLGVLMARVDFLEKDNTKSKELVQRVKTLEISIEKISMIINKLSGKIDSIPKGNSDTTEALIKQVDIMREKFHDNKSLLLRMEKLEKRAGAGFPIGISGEAGNETLLARVATIEENINTTTDRLMGLRIRTKSVMTRVDCLEEIARSTKSPNDIKKMDKMQHLKAPSNSITNELAMKVDYLEQKLGSLQDGRSAPQSKEPLNQQILMARVEALEEESRRKVGANKPNKRNQNSSPKASVSSPSFLGTKRPNIKHEPGQGEMFTPSPVAKSASRKENAGKSTSKKKPADDVIDTNTILGLLDEIDREDNDSAKAKDKKEEKSLTDKQVSKPRTSETSEDDDEALSKFISNKRKSSEKSSAKGAVSDRANKKKIREAYVDSMSSPDERTNLADEKPKTPAREPKQKAYVDPFASPDDPDERTHPVDEALKTLESEPKQKIPVKISLKPLKKPSPDPIDIENIPIGDIIRGEPDENNNIVPVDLEEKEKFGNPIFDSLPLTSPTKDDAANRLKRAQKYFKKGGPRHKFFS